jgi:hypothetical protein
MVPCFVALLNDHNILQCCDDRVQGWEAESMVRVLLKDDHILQCCDGRHDGNVKTQWTPESNAFGSHVC